MYSPFEIIYRSNRLKRNDVVLDTKILRLHSRISVKVFWISSFLLTFKEIFCGETINCLDHGQDKDVNLNVYCWTYSTYSVVPHFRDCKIYKDCIYPGVGQLLPGDAIVVHRYYQWTCITLFFQALVCYAPRFLWKSFCEDGLQGKLSLNGRLFFYPIGLDSVSPMEAKDHLGRLTQFFLTHKSRHQQYFFQYCFFELMGLFTVVANILLIDILLGNQFLEYGSRTLQYYFLRPHGKRRMANPMVQVFPYMAKCDFRLHGPSGNIIRKDPVCLLPLNTLNDKVYLFLWFYLFFTLGVSCLAFVYRLLTILCPCLRYRLLLSRAGNKCKAGVVKDLCRRICTGEWFVMYIMSNNVSRDFFQEFLEALWEEMYEKKLSI